MIKDEDLQNFKQFLLSACVFSVSLVQLDPYAHISGSTSAIDFKFGSKVFFLQMIYTGLQKITYKRYRKKIIQCPQAQPLSIIIISKAKSKWEKKNQNK